MHLAKQKDIQRELYFILNSMLFFWQRLKLSLKGPSSQILKEISNIIIFDAEQVHSISLSTNKHLEAIYSKIMPAVLFLLFVLQSIQ